ncbi:MAG: cytochrome c-type biogenesis protein CcmH [Acidobacteriota bacterium]|nr:cytochrome c-type biogenesis protein CcmH [Acidobacteriota bacterium]
MRGKTIRALLLVVLAGAWMGMRGLAQNPGAAQATNPAQAPQGDMNATGPSEPVPTGPKAPATDPRVQKLGHDLMCMCGCNEILIECQHQGSDQCLMHDREMAEVEQRVAGGESDSLVLQSFVQEYGPQVLVVPPAKGFDLTAWLMPIFASLIGLSLLIIVVQRWRERALKPAVAAGPKVKVKPEHLARARAEIEKEEY